MKKIVRMISYLFIFIFIFTGNNFTLAENIYESIESNTEIIIEESKDGNSEDNKVLTTEESIEPFVPCISWETHMNKEKCSQHIHCIMCSDCGKHQLNDKVTTVHSGDFYSQGNNISHEFKCDINFGHGEEMWVCNEIFTEDHSGGGLLNGDRCKVCGKEYRESCKNHMGGDHYNDGKCIRCGTQYQIHKQTQNVKVWTSEEKYHTPYYTCNYYFVGNEKNLYTCDCLFEAKDNNGEKLLSKHISVSDGKGGEYCKTCGYYTKFPPVGYSDECRLSIKDHKAALDGKREVIGQYSLEELAEKEELSVSNTSREKIENATHKVGKVLSLSGTNYSKYEKVQNYVEKGRYLKNSPTQSISVDLSNYLHWFVRVDEDRAYLHFGPAKSCRVGVHSGNTEFACQQKGSISGGNWATSNTQAAIALWRNNNKWSYQAQYGHATNATSAKQELNNIVIPLLTNQVKKAMLEDNINYDVFKLVGKDEYTTSIASENILYNVKDSYFVHCTNRWNYGLVETSANIVVGSSCQHEEYGQERTKLYGNLSFKYEGIVATQPKIEYKDGTWVATDIKIEGIDRVKLKFDDLGNPYGTIIVTSTDSNDNSESKVYIKVPIESSKVGGNESLDGKHISVNLYVNGSTFSPNKLYVPGDIITLDGTRCITNEYYTILNDTKKEFSTYRGISIDVNGFQLEKDGQIFSKIDKYEKNEHIEWRNVIPPYNYNDDEYRNWKSDSYKIVNIASTLYDAQKGVHYGTITVTGLTDHGNECEKRFNIYFGNQGESYYSKVNTTIKINSLDNCGTVKVNYRKYISSKESKMEEVIATNGMKLDVVKGSQIIINSTANEGYIYRDITTQDGNILKDSKRDENNKNYKEFISDSLVTDDTFIVNFEKANISDIDIPNVEDKNIKIVEDSNELNTYSLKVTSNNDIWGTAWIERDGGAINEIENAVAGEKYVIHFEASLGYYFLNLYYDNIDTPLESFSMENGIAEIIMPDNSLEIKVVFLPIPKEENAKFENMHNVYFVSEFENRCDGIGSMMPNNLADVICGSEVQIAVTPQKGYEFERWYFTQSNNHLTNCANESVVAPDSDVNEYGSGKFIMPDYDIIAHAVFKKATSDEAKKLTIKIVGEGNISVNNITAASGTSYKLKAGTKLNISAKLSKIGKFKYWVDENGRIVSENINFIFEMRNCDTTLIAYVEDDNYTNSIGNKIIFKTEQPDGGKILNSDELLEKNPGSKIEVEVEVNPGWKFDYWGFTNMVGEKINPNSEYDARGLGYFIMPDFDVIASAVFKEDTSGKNVYITSTQGGTAYALVNGKEEKTITNAFPKSVYDIEYKEDSGYEFLGWQYSWNQDIANEINPKIYESSNKMVVPDSDLTVTAVFKNKKLKDTDKPKIKITSNNYSWGDAWIEVNGNPISWKEREKWLDVAAGKQYNVIFNPQPGYKFIYWEAFDGANKYFVEYPDMNNPEEQGIGKIIVPTYDLELMAYFEPIEKINHYSLTLKSDIEEGVILSGEVTNEPSGTICHPKIQLLNEDYEFEYWYRIAKDGNIVILNYLKNFDYELVEDVTIYAKVNKKEIKEVEVINYTITFIKEGDGDGYIIDQDGNKYLEAETSTSIVTQNENFIINYVVGEGSQFDGLVVDGEFVGNSESVKLKVEKNMIVKVVFSKMPQVTYNIDDFKIISVRDLQWKNYFVDKNDNLRGKIFKIPDGNTTMLYSVEGRPEAIKTGYAVEFELTTVTYNHDKVVLVVKPEILGSKGKIEWENIKDNLTNKYMDDDYMENIKDFEKIIIFANPNINKDLNNLYKTSYQASGLFSEGVKNNGIAIEMIKWNWVYYLPAELNIRENNITIKFYIEVHEVDGSITANELLNNTKNTKKYDLNEYVETYKESKWDGKVFKYNLNESLLDDIYDNAT